MESLIIYMLAPMAFLHTAQHFDIRAGVGYSDTIVLDDRLSEGAVFNLSFIGKYDYFDISVTHQSSVMDKDRDFGNNNITISKTWRIK